MLWGINDEDLYPISAVLLTPQPINYNKRCSVVLSWSSSTLIYGVLIEQITQNGVTILGNFNATIRVYYRRRI